MRIYLLSIVCLAVAACAAPDSQSTNDAGKASDSGTADSGSGDHDAGQTDSGWDPRPVDAGDIDAGLQDAGTSEVQDAGPQDAGSQDAGPADGGPHDAGIITDDPWTISGDVVIDSSTGLSWDAADGPGGATYGAGSAKYTWQEAMDYCTGKGARLATYADAPAASEAGDLATAAHADWLHFSATFGGAWNSWSGTEVDGLPNKAWHYYLDNTGSAVGYSGLKDTPYHARCVR